MHDQALEYVAAKVREFGLDRVGVTVLDLGGRDVNGTTRHLFTEPARYVVVDIEEHPSVDVVADAADLCLDELFDVVVCTEVLEHTELAAEIVATAWRHLAPGGVFVATMAGPGRAEHGAAGGSRQAGEFYRNVAPEWLDGWLSTAGFAWWQVDEFGADVRCCARKG